MARENVEPGRAPGISPEAEARRPPAEALAAPKPSSAAAARLHDDAPTNRRRIGVE